MNSDGDVVRVSSNGSVELSKPVLAICGAGNAGHALAVVASQRFEGDVVWLTSSEEKAAVLRRGVFSQDGLQSTGVVEGRADNVRIISADPAEVIPHADIVLITVPAFAHAPILKRIEPYLKDRVLLGVIPSRSGFEFEVTELVPQLGAEGRTAFGLQTLPWMTRAQEIGKTVCLYASKGNVLAATIPAQSSKAIVPRLSRLFGVPLVPTSNFLNMTLGNPGQLIHPGLMYGHFRSWDGDTYSADEIPLFYIHATDDGADAVERMSDEVVALATKIQARSAGTLDLSGVLGVHEWLRLSYPTQTQDFTTVATCFRTGPGVAISSPMTEVSPGAFVPNFTHRFLSEELPFGLAVTRAIADLADVETPTIDVVIRWAQEKLGKEYLVDGKVEGRDTADLPMPQNYGIHSLDALIDSYGTHRAVRPDLASVAP